MDRKAEIRTLLQLSPDAVRQQAGDHLIVCPDVNALHQRMADDIAEEIAAHNARSQPTRLILPVGPTGQYPLLADILTREWISLANVWLFFMDEYCDESGQAVTADHPLSFKREAQALLLNRLDEACGLSPERVIFPNERNIDQLATLIEQAGGIDTCYGGIGIHGHVAFNEPEPGVKDSGPRRVTLNDFTVTINAIRAGVGGNLDCFPRYAYTLGMREILSAKRVRLYCRNGCEFDWANTVLRVALLGTPDDDYPVTYIRERPYTIITDEATLASPQKLI